MTNNDILRRLRYTLNLNDEGMAHLFALGGQAATNEEVDLWTRPDGDPDHEPMTDYALATFLNGLIVARRGPREGPALVAERELDNNLILRKVRVAFSLKTDDLVALAARMDKTVGAHEVNAFFRRPDQRQYRPLNDQYLRYFLSGLQRAERGRAEGSKMCSVPFAYNTLVSQVEKARA